MNIINKLTLRNLKENKRRTLVTIIGVIISVAMLTAVATLAVSFIDLGQKQHISKEGEWHALYKDVNQRQLDAIRKDKNTKEVILSEDIGYANLEGSKNKHKPYLFVKQYNKEGFENFAIEIIDGIIPQNENQLLISEHIITNGGVDLKVGDKIVLDIGQRVTSDEELNFNELDQSLSLQTTEGIKNTNIKEYIISGIMKRPDWEPRQAPGYTALSYLDEASISENETLNVSVIWNKVNRSVKKKAETLSDTLKVENYSINTNLLRYYGVINNDGLRTTMYGLAAIIMSVIIIGSVSLIYNAFSISVSERSRHLGMLSSVGATKKQKRNSVFFEGFIIGLIGIPIGILSGILGIAVTFYFINPILQNTMGISEKITVVVTSLSIIVASIVSILTIFFSTYIPAKKASNISAIDAIRQTTDVKLTRKEVKTSKLVRKIFGIEAEFGLKNIKRNKRRYQAVVFSLVVSIVLFLTVSFFTDQLKLSSEALENAVNYDIAINSYSSRDYTEAFSDKYIDRVAAIEEINDVSYVFSPDDISTILNEEQVPQSFHNLLDAGKLYITIYLNVLDDKHLKSYAKEVGIDYGLLVNKNKLPAIIINRVTSDEGKYGYTKAVNMDVGDSIELSYYDWRTGEDKVLSNIDVVALTNQFPLGVSESQYVGELNVIVSRETFAQLNEGNLLENGVSALYLTSEDPLGDRVNDKLEVLNEGRKFIHNIQKEEQDENQVIILMSVFIYGFVGLISAISIANIFNTISTSVSLRKREFAMLKSVGMTPKGFNRMINYESIFYGIKSLAYGLPISIGIMFLIYRFISQSFAFPFRFPWISVLIVIIAVFIIVGSAMLYSSSKVRKETIIDGLKQENN